MNDIQQQRDEFDQLGKLYPQQASVQIEPALINNVHTYWFTPANAVANRLLVYLHGGVYALGSVRSHGSWVSHLAYRLNATVLFVDYALAPERPYPAANQDVLAVYKALLTDYPDYEIGFIGDSAGGGLIVSAVGNMLSQHLPLPYAAAMISPWINLLTTNSSYASNQAKDPVLNQQIIAGATDMYLNGTAIELANPAALVLSSFPPVLVMVGSDEVLLDDSVAFYQQIKAVQADSTLTIYKDQHHVWPLSAIDSDASQQLLAQMQTFFATRGYSSSSN